MHKENYHRIKENFRQFVEELKVGDLYRLPFVSEKTVWILEEGKRILSKDTDDVSILKNVRTIGKDLAFDIYSINEFTEKCVSVTAKITITDPTNLSEKIDICVHTIWVYEKDEWVLYQVLSSNGNKILNVDNSHIHFSLSDLYNQLPVGIIGCDLNDILSIEFMNPVILSLLGYESLEDLKHMVGSSFLSLLHSDDIATLREFYTDVSKHDANDMILLRLHKRDFSYLWVQVTGNILQEDMLMLVCMDYTDQYEKNELLQRHNDKVRSNNDMFRMYLTNMPGGFYRMIPSEGYKLDYVNDTFCRLTGYTNNEVVNEDYTKLLRKEDRSFYKEAVSNLSEFAHEEALQYHILRKDGSYVFVNDQIRSIRQSDGKMYLYSLVTKELNTKPKESGVSALIEDMPIAYCTYKYEENRGLKVIFANNAFCRLVGYTQDEYIKMSKEYIYIHLFMMRMYLY